MFDFHKLQVYQRVRTLNGELAIILARVRDPDRKRQLLRASMSVQLNLAEGAGRFSDRDKRKFFIISRASAFECVAILDLLLDAKIVSKKEYDRVHDMYEEVSKMLYAMIKGLT